MVLGFLKFWTEINNLIDFQIGRTLVSQGHLVPMHMIPMPVYWSYDHALQLYPLPDLIVLGDNTKAFNTEIQGCQVMNVVSGFFI